MFTINTCPECGNITQIGNLFDCSPFLCGECAKKEENNQEKTILKKEEVKCG